MHMTRKKQPLSAWTLAHLLTLESSLLSAGAIHTVLTWIYSRQAMRVHMLLLTLKTASRNDQGMHLRVRLPGRRRGGGVNAWYAG